MKLRSSAVLGAAISLALGGAGMTTATHAQQAVAATAVAVPQAGWYRFALGDLQVVALSDGTVPLDTHATLKGETMAQTDRLLAAAHLSNPVENSVNAFLIERGSHRILIDTGAGDFFGPGYGGKLLASLAAAGVAPEQIDEILLTHLHPDHEGGLLHNGRAVFPNATIHVGKPDVDLFLAAGNQQGVEGVDKAFFHQATMALAPYAARGRLKPFIGETQVLPDITAIPAPGHTPGHSLYRVESKGQSLTFIGDLIHVAAVQFPTPGVTITYDVDPSLAAKQRKERFDEFVAQHELVAADHLPFPGVGYIERQGNAYRFIPLNYRNRD